MEETLFGTLEMGAGCACDSEAGKTKGTVVYDFGGFAAGLCNITGFASEKRGSERNAYDAFETEVASVPLVGTASTRVSRRLILVLGWFGGVWDRRPSGLPTTVAIFACSLVLGIAGVVIKRSFGFSLEVSLGTGVVESTVNANFEPVAGGVEIRLAKDDVKGVGVGEGAGASRFTLSVLFVSKSFTSTDCSEPSGICT